MGLQVERNTFLIRCRDRLHRWVSAAVGQYRNVDHNAILVAAARIADHRHELQFFCKTFQDLGYLGTLSREIAVGRAGTRVDAELFGKCLAARYRCATKCCQDNPDATTYEFATIGRNEGRASANTLDLLNATYRRQSSLLPAGVVVSGKGQTPLVNFNMTRPLSWHVLHSVPLLAFK
jgi:hypothetical protein